MKNLIEPTKNGFEFRAFVAETYLPLIQLKQENKQEDFYALMEKILPQIKLYVTRQLKIALKKQSLPQGKYKVEDFIDELYIEAFENIHEVKNVNDFYSWLFKKVDTLLEDTIVDEDFDNTFFKNIDDYTHMEWDAMEEKFSTDGDGDLMMLEELDDLSYPKQNYSLEAVFVEEEELDFIKRINEKLSEEEIHQRIDLILHLLPTSMRTIFELTINQQFDVEEIAKIKGMEISEVERVLANAKHTILTSFVKKYTPQ